jgi:hypothetical protein
MMPSMVDDGTDGWMEKTSQPQRPLLYVILYTVTTMQGSGGHAHTTP